MPSAKGTKRATSAGASSPKKKSRVDPMFAGIIATLQGADELSEQCRDMVIAFVAPSLTTPKSERHSLQNLGVKMIDEMLREHQKKLTEAVEVAQKELTDLEGSKATLTQTLDDAKTRMEERKTDTLSAQKASEESTEARKAAEKALAEARDVLTKSEARHDDFEKQKAAIDAAYQEHFKAPMDADETPHYPSLKPFIEHLGLEDSLSSALPSSCAKPKDQRGSFDQLVLGEMGKAMVAKIAGLEQSIADEAAAVSLHKAGVVTSEEAVTAKTTAEKDAASNLEVASAAQKEAEAALQKASEDWTSFEPRVQEANDKYNLQNTKRMDFEEGALKDFGSLREKEKEVPTPVEEEAAPAGA